MSIIINFDALCELYNDSNKKIKLRQNILSGLVNDIKYNSFTNSDGDIVSNVVGIIYLLKCVTKIKNNDTLNIELTVNLSNANIILNNEVIEEIIWRILPPMYDETGLLKFSMDGIFRIKDYNLKILDTPQNITYKLL